MEELLKLSERFNFEIPPVGIKYTNFEPRGISRLQKKMDFCEMLKEAQSGVSFFCDVSNFTCIGPIILGMRERDHIFERGLVGPRLGIFKEERANRRIYQYLPRIPKESVKYVVFCPVSYANFEPDIVVFVLTVEQTEIMLRAKSYATGEMWTAKGTPVATCAWLFVYPYLTGEINFTISGLGFGMKARKLFPEGRILFSVPWDKLPQIIENLKIMEWVPESFVIGPEGHKSKVRKIVETLTKETERGKRYEEESSGSEQK
ncbi:MAG: DUF169 domain-containing protein [Deltaproteobacteria bacterium]|nr:DUF169 domain-containing protein [Deltaproteobacteria bacterium]